MPTWMSVSSTEGSGTSVAPAMSAQCTSFVTEISICADNGGQQQQVWCWVSLFQCNDFPWPAARIKKENGCFYVVEKKVFSFIFVTPFDAPLQTEEVGGTLLVFFNETIFSKLVRPKITLANLGTVETEPKTLSSNLSCALYVSLILSHFLLSLRVIVCKTGTIKTHLIGLT